MKYIPIAAYENYVTAHLAMGRLEAESIRCWLMDENTVTMMPIWSQALGGIKLMVPDVQAPRAQEILASLEKAHKSRHACPQCGSHNTEEISSPRKIGNWLSAISTFLLGNYAIPIQKVRRCFDCGHESEP